MRFLANLMRFNTAQILIILLTKASTITATTSNLIGNSEGSEKLPTVALEHTCNLPSDSTAELSRLGPEDDTIIEPYIFIVRQDFRRRQDVLKVLVDDLDKFSYDSKSDYVLRSEHLGTYFYIRNTTLKDARHFVARQQEHILTATRYLSLIGDRRNDSGLSSENADASPGTRRIEPRLESINTLSANEALAPRRKPLFSYNHRPLERDLSDRNLDNRHASTRRAGYGAHIYVLDTGFDIEHEAFQHARACGQITRPIYAGPKSAKGRLEDGNRQSDRGTSVLGTIIGDKIGIARDADVVVNFFSLNDEEFREGKPLLLSTLVRLYDAILSSHEPDDAIIVNISPQRYSRRSGGLPHSEMILDCWLEEVIRSLGRLDNVVIVTAADNNEEDGAWPASIDQLSNQIVVGSIDEAGAKISDGKNIWAYALARDIRAPIGGSKREYQRKNDTALAAAAISGILADHLSRHRGLSLQEAKNRLREAAHLRHGTIDNIPILWIGEKDDRSKLHADGSRTAATPANRHYPRKATPRYIKDHKSPDAAIVGNRTLSALPTTFLHKRNPLPVPGYVTSTQVVLEIELRPYPTRKTTTTKGFVTTIPLTATETMTRTRVSVFPVREIFTSVQHAVATTIIAVPVREPNPEFSDRICYPIERGAYAMRDNMMDYIQDTFCRKLDEVGKKFLEGPAGQCGKQVLVHGPDGGPDRIASNCGWTAIAYPNTLAEMEIGAAWNDAGPPPTYETCLRVFREQLVDGCNTIPMHTNPLNYKGGGKVTHHGDWTNGGRAQYWIEPQRKPQLMRKPKWPRSKYVVCQRKITEADASNSYICYGWGVIERDFGERIWDIVKNKRHCAPTGKIWVEYINDATSKIEVRFGFETMQFQDKCTKRAINDGGGQNVEVKLLPKNVDIDIHRDLP
ncbi:hypothetical protein TWF696_005035 [Orbilia brochopaga]|uniref:Peptidase S8/S53 domain-containing protein n=1 Tax=Orbilia brochopaga TaxID=3140254 RepID=A0AAV9V0R5_9PEZI